MPTPAASSSPGLEGAIRRHRIYYEVQRETAQYGERRILVVLQVWLWATLERGAGNLPRSPGCRTAVAALAAVAADAIARTEPPPRPEVEPFHWALYASKHVPDADEVRLELSLRAPPGVDGPEQVERERVLGELKRALEGIGVAQGGYKGGPPLRVPERPEEPEPWAARPAGQVFRRRVAPAPA